MNDAQQQMDDETCRALGMFVVRFSELLHELEQATLEVLGLIADQERFLLGQAALSGRTAGPIATAFFSAFHKRWEGSLTPDDIGILKCLRKEIEAAIGYRNRLMHDAWKSTAMRGDSEAMPMARTRVRAHATGAEFEMVQELPSKIADRMADLNRLSRLVRETTFPAAWSEKPELHRRMHVVGGKVEFREQPQ